MHKSTAQALYALHMDLFLEGLAEAPKPEEFALTEAEGRKVRKDRYADKIRAIRERRVA